MQTEKVRSKKDIDQLSKRFFQVFNNENSRVPNLELLKDILIEDAVIIKHNGSIPEIFDVAGFIEPRKRILTNGTLTDFAEIELSERTQVFGSIAQRVSLYKKKGYLEGTPFETKGIKMFQFVNTNRNWKISALAWDDEREGFDLPESL